MVWAGYNAAGDPGYWMRLAGPTEFTPDPGHAAFLDWTPTAIVNLADFEFGFDANTTTFMSNPYFKQDSDVLKAQNESGGADIPIGALVADTRTKLLLIPRSTVRLHHFVQDGSLLWVGTQAQTGTVNLGTSSVGAASVPHLHSLGLVDLPASGYPAWDADFSTVTDSKSAPAHNSTFDCDADFHMRSTFTYQEEDSQYVIWSTRYADGNNRIYTRAVHITGNLLIVSVASGTPTTLLDEAAVFSDGVNHQVDISGEGSSFKVRVDNVLKLDTTVTDNQTNAGGYIQRVLTVNDIELSTHPYPALGIATDRVIAPQANDVADCNSDCLVYLRNITLSTGGNGHLIRFRIQDATNYLVLQIVSTGRTYLWKVVAGAGTALINVDAATSDGDDVAIIVEGADAEIFVNGTSIGSTAGAVFADETGSLVEDLATGGTLDSIEFFPRDVSGLLHPDLV